MSKKDIRKIKRSRSKAYRQAYFFVNLFMLIGMVVFIIVSLLHVFTPKRITMDNGVEFYNMREYEAAIESFDKALSYNQWFAGDINVDIEMYIADCYLRLNEFNMAGEVYSRIESTYSKGNYDKEELDFLITLSDALDSYQNGEYNNLSVFTKAVELGYDDISLYAASCYEKQGNYDKMREYYDIYVERVGLNKYLAYKYAVYYMRNANYTEALSYIAQAESFTDTSYTKRLAYLKIVCYEKQSNFTEAYNLALQFATAYPDDEDGQDILEYLYTRVNPDPNLVNNIYNTTSPE